MSKLIDKYDLFIFDLDDTLVKTEQYHYTSWLTVLKELKSNNFYFDYFFYCSKFHSDNKDSIINYLKNELYIENYENIMLKKNNFYFNLIKKEKNNIELTNGALEFLESIIKLNKTCCLIK